MVVKYYNKEKVVEQILKMLFVIFHLNIGYLIADNLSLLNSYIGILFFIMIVVLSASTHIILFHCVPEIYNIMKERLFIHILSSLSFGIKDGLVVNSNTDEALKNLKEYLKDTLDEHIQLGSNEVIDDYIDEFTMMFAKDLDEIKDSRYPIFLKDTPKLTKADILRLGWNIWDIYCEGGKENKFIVSKALKITFPKELGDWEYGVINSKLKDNSGKNHRIRIIEKTKRFHFRTE